MPRKPKPMSPSPISHPLQAHPPPRKTSSKSKSQLADWTAKNARAKAIIMSTLIPGSEPWKIAESLEFAADIWKALEEKYGPKDGTEEQQDFVEKWIEKGLEDADVTSGDIARPTNQGASKVRESNNNRKDSLTKQTKQQSETTSVADETQLMEKIRRSEEDHARRDQRLLWALLNGGKEHEVDQFLLRGQTARA